MQKFRSKSPDCQKCTTAVYELLLLRITFRQTRPALAYWRVQINMAWLSEFTFLPCAHSLRAHLSDLHLYTAPHSQAKDRAHIAVLSLRPKGVGREARAVDLGRELRARNLLL